MKKIYLIRHGETESNRKGIFRGRLDIPLSKKGEEQAELLVEYFKDKKIEIVFSSPLSRAFKTAKICFPQNNVFKDELLNNLDLGEWSGKEKEEIKIKSPAEWAKWVNHPEKIKFPKGETLGDVYKRAKKLLFKLSGIKEDNIALVSHRSVIKTILAAGIGLKNDYFWKFHLDNASVSTMIYTPERGFTIYKLNDTSHLKNFITEWF